EDLLFEDIEKHLVRIVPNGAQGVLRGGRLLREKAKSIAEIFSEKDCKKTLTGLASECETDLPIGVPVSWLDKSYEVGTPFEKLFAKYQDAARHEFNRLAAEKLKELPRTPFAGAEACQSCHPTAYKIWLESGHARAMATLEAV